MDRPQSASSMKRIATKGADAHQNDLYEGYNGYDDQEIFPERHSPVIIHPTSWQGRLNFPLGSLLAKFI